MKSFKEQQGIEEAPLVMKDGDLLDSIWEKVKPLIAEE